MSRGVGLATVGAAVLAALGGHAGAVAAEEPSTLPAVAELVWASDREDGRHEVYFTRVGSGEVSRLTRGGGRQPGWSPDGTWIAYVDPVARSVHVMRPDGSDARVVCTELPAFDQPRPYFWRRASAAVGSATLVCGRRLPGDDVGYFEQDLVGGEERLLVRQSDTALRGFPFGASGVTNDRRFLVGWVIDLFKDGYAAENGEFRSAHSTVLLELAAPERLFFLGPGCLSALPPAGSLVYHVSREGPTMPDIFRLDTRDLKQRESYAVEVGLPDADWGHEYMPSVSNDGRWLVYAASEGCHEWHLCDYEIFAHRLGAGAAQRQRLTVHPRNDSFPSLFIPPSPTGRLSAARPPWAPHVEVPAPAGGGAATPPAALDPGAPGCAVGAPPSTAGPAVLALIVLGALRGARPTGARRARRT